MEKKYNALFIGSSTKDMIMVVDEPPESDARISASDFTISYGGVATTAAFAHKKLGGSTALITIIGEDDTGASIRADIEEQHYDRLQLLVTDRYPSTISSILVEKNGKRLISIYGGCSQEMTFEKLDLSILDETHILHLGVMNRDLMLQLAEYCKTHCSALLSIDGGNLPKEYADALLPYADLFIPDHKTAMRTLGMNPADACRYYVDAGARFAAVTAAEEGVTAFDGENWYQVPAPKVNVVDTLGAGDNFHGAFLYAMSRDWDMNRRLQFASMFASLSCEGLGARRAAPTLEQVLERMGAVS